ncbi:MAG: tetratricopeptide repeat protein [Candidatus Eisenbacteria bacterium]|nr:tetratricopeptide repeat protein [Candidatus Eisenbacteria bacterium]
MKGLCYFERREYAEMQRSFDEALRIEPRFERKDDILFTSAMAAERERNRPEAVRRYRELVQAYRGSERGDEGLLHIGDLYFEATRYDSAGLAYEELGRMTRNDTFFRESQIKLAETWVRRQNSETAIELLKPLLPKDEKQNRTADDFPARVRLLWARADNDIGRHEEALARLRGAVELYPASNFATEAQFQVGYTYEVYLDSLESARKAYDQAAKMSAKSVFREQAQIRLNNLNALQDLRSRISETGNTDREQQATAALKIAELFLFAQDENDEALAKYREVVRDYGDTKAAPRAAYGAAWMRLKRYEGARDSALSEFAGVIRTYPASQQARSALEILAAEGADTVGLGGLLEEVRPDTLAALPSLPEPPDTSRAGVSASPLEGDSLATGDEELDDIRRRGARSRDPRATQLSPILDPAKHDSIAAARAAQRRGARPPGPGTVAPDSLVNPDRVVTPGEVPPDSSKVPGGEP